MQRHQDTNGSGRWLGLLGVSALALLAGCDWISGSTPIGPPPRPGAEVTVQPSAAIPPAPANQQHDAGVLVEERAGCSRRSQQGLHATVRLDTAGRTDAAG